MTRIPAKARLYERETYFREGLSDVEAAFGAGLDEGLRGSALLMVKPDGLAAAKLGVVHAYLAEHDFVVVGVRQVRFDRLLWRELWRYQLTSATLDRLAVNDCVLPVAPALLLMLRSTGKHDLPATVRLSGLKGSATLSAQLPGSLRSLLGQPNRVLSFVHVADEPADLVRELGLLFDSPTRREVLHALVEGRLPAIDRRLLDEALRLDAEGGRSFDKAEALERAAGEVRRRKALDPTLAVLADHVLRHLEHMTDGEPVPWRELVRLLDQLGVRLDRWDLATLGTSFVVCDEPGATKMLENPDPEMWRQARSGLPACVGTTPS